MALPQDINPINSEVMDTLMEASKTPWIKTSDLSFTKVLYTGSESGSWAVQFRWLKGYVAPPHKHLSGSHTFILSGKLQVRDGVLNAGDYVYEANGMLHGETKALEDTEYLFICNGPIIFFDEDNFTRYTSWEEMQKLAEGQVG
ncbi:MAG: cupin domain-containing protein [Proteobacteria bacterium]|jgi:quercetin dioxygenase-like cupin family protein|nr:cupin domain-containing protein [Pseudomonadota bacterium]